MKSGHNTKTAANKAVLQRFLDLSDTGVGSILTAVWKLQPALWYNSRKTAIPGDARNGAPLKRGNGLGGADYPIRLWVGYNHQKMALTPVGLFIRFFTGQLLFGVFDQVKQRSGEQRIALVEGLGGYRHRNNLLDVAKARELLELA